MGRLRCPAQGGKVLLAGGYYESSAELYHPGTRKFTPTGNMFSERSFYTLVRLTDGMVLAAGGYDSFDSVYLSGAEIYDSDTGTWSRTSFMSHARAGYAAGLLGDGTVLVAGGERRLVGQSTAEVYHPTSGTWTKAASMNSPRGYVTGIVLRSGKVLVAGGADASRGRAIRPGERQVDPHREHALAPVLVRGRPALQRNGAGGWRTKLIRTQ